MASPTVLYAEESGLGDGDPAVSVAGTGESVPRGVEAVFSYNGLLLNDRTVIDKFRIISIDGLDDADVRDTRDINPGDHGETPGGAYYGGRTIAIQGRVEAYELHKLRDMQQALRSAFADLSEEKRFYFLTGDPSTDHYISCKKFSKNQWGEEQKHQNHFFRDFLITLRASNPRFLKHQTKTVEITAFKNYSDNPGGETTAKYSSFVDYTVTREASGTDGVSAHVGSWRDKHAFDGSAGGDSNSGFKSFTLPAAGDYIFSTYIWLPTAWNGGNLGLSLEGWTGATATVLQRTDTTKRDQWQRVYSKITVLSGDLSGTIVLRPTSSPTTVGGGLFYTDSLQIEENDGSDIPRRYIDGSYDNASWTGTANASSSIGFAETQAALPNLGNFPSQPTFKVFGNMETVKFDIEGDSIQSFFLTDDVEIAAADIYHADIANNTLRNNAGDNKFRDFDPDSDWPEIPAGSNYLVIPSDGCVPLDEDAKIQVIYRDTYI